MARFRYRCTYSSNTLIAPSLRTVAVEVALECADGEFVFYRGIHPAVAFGSFVMNSVRLESGVEVPNSESSEVMHQTLIVHQQDGCLTTFEEMPTPDSRMKLVVCPWPQSEDDQRLAKVADEMELELRDYMARRPDRTTPEGAAR